MAGHSINLVLPATTRGDQGTVVFIANLLLPVRVSDDLLFAVICAADADKARRARPAGHPRG